MQQDDFYEGQTIYCKNFKEYQNYIKTLIALDYGISIEPHNHIITILTMPRREKE